MFGAFVTGTGKNEKPKGGSPKKGIFFELLLWGVVIFRALKLPKFNIACEKTMVVKTRQKILSETFPFFLGGDTVDSYAQPVCFWGGYNLKKKK